MGKASKWFRGLLGLKKPDSSSSSSPSQPPATSKPPPKQKWSFVKSYREKEPQKLDFHNKPIENSPTLSSQPTDNDDPSKHAIAVAAATAAVAEAAVAAAQAAAAVVKLTSSGRAISTNATSTAIDRTKSTTLFGAATEAALKSPSAYFSGSSAGYGNREEWAAVMIQKHFRAYLSRRALRALRALVRLQALVRGHIVRKGTTARLRRMQALFRAQIRARVGRAQIFESPIKSNLFNYPGPATPEKFEHMIKVRSLKHGENVMLKRNGSQSNSKFTSNQEIKAHKGSSNSMDARSFEKEISSTMKTNSRDDERSSDKILEVDNGGKPQAVFRRRNLFHSSHLSLGSDQYSHSFTTSKDSTAHQTVPSPSSCEVHSLSPLKFSQDVDEQEEPYCTADNSPQFYSASSKRGTNGSANRGPFTPTKSDGSRSCLSGYSDYPNYMSYTESSKAKIRSLSAPKQRPQYERSSSTKRYSIHGFGESRINNSQKVSAMKYSNFTSKAYPGSGRLDRLGMPLREEAIGFSGGHWHRYI